MQKQTGRVNMVKGVQLDNRVDVQEFRTSWAVSRWFEVASEVAIPRWGILPSS